MYKYPFNIERDWSNRRFLNLDIAASATLNTVMWSNQVDKQFAGAQFLSSIPQGLASHLPEQTLLGMELLLLFFFLCPVLSADWKPAFLLEYIDKFDGHSVTLVTSLAEAGLLEKQIRKVKFQQK